MINLFQSGDAFKKVQPGQRLEIPAEAYNAFIDAALAVREHKQFGTDAAPFFRQSGVVKLKNTSGADQARFAILGLANPIIQPGDNPDEFKRQVTFQGVVPVQNDHAGRFAVLLEPLPAGKIGLAVIAGGGLKYFPSVWVNVNLLRHFGCTLPIQLWYLGDHECDPYMKRLLKPFGVACINARQVERQHPCRILCGWELKPYATLYSPFAQVLFLDADNGVVRDPTYLFDTPQFREHGAIFWPDYACWTLKPEVWHIFGMDWMVPQAPQEIAFESGQYLIDKTRCWPELRMALWYAEHSDFVFRVVYGDKECFHLAWRFLGTEYAMPPQGPGWNQHTIVQYDFDGQVVFQHRCQDKWKLGGGNRRNPSLANEDLCFNLVADLRQIWDGVPWHNPDPTPQEQRVIEELTGRRFLYRRVGYDERPMRLEASNKVGEGAAECERRWDVNIDDGRTILTLSRLDRPTCHLERKGDGIWTGQWLEHEQMPVEFIPLKD